MTWLWLLASFANLLTHFLDVVTTEMFLQLNVRREANQPWKNFQVWFPAGWGFIRVAIGAVALIPGVALFLANHAQLAAIVDASIAALLLVSGPAHNWLQLRRDHDEIAALKARGLFPTDRDGKLL